MRGRAIAGTRPVPAIVPAILPKAASLANIVPKVTAAAALALCLIAFPVATAHAEETGCPPNQPLCLFPDKPSPTPDPTPTQEPSPAPAAPKPAPVQPTAAPVAPQPAPTTATESAAPTQTAIPTPTAPGTSAPSAASAPPSTEPNWNKPIESSKKATQAAVMVGKDNNSGTDLSGVMSIMGGVLLVGVAGLAFALWSRNRLAAH